jgi:hypothetical protein
MNWARETVSGHRHLVLSMEHKEQAGFGVAAAPALAGDDSVKAALSQSQDASEFCTTLAKLFRVKLSEVAVMRVDHGLLKFVLPEELKTAGAIPVSSSSAIAARTASTKKAEIFNNFAKIKHARVFETVKLVTPEDAEKNEQSQIQKLMSVPVLDGQHKVLGVIQVCRKGFDAVSAGADFSSVDLDRLAIAAAVAAGMSVLHGEA